MTLTAGPAPFVGREQEMAALRACLDRACAGHGTLALIAGEPGIGKTRLAEEIAAVAQEQGARVLWGRTYEGEGAPAYWPWIEILRGLLRGADAEWVRAAFDVHAAEVAQLLPELRRLLPDIPAPQAPRSPVFPRLAGGDSRWGDIGDAAVPARDGERGDPALPIDPAQARFRLFDALTQVLLAAARSSASPIPCAQDEDSRAGTGNAEPGTARGPGLVLVLDDLHWADEPSLLLLEFLARTHGEAPLLVVGTYRDLAVQRGHPLARVLGDLTPWPGVTTLTLAGLEPAQVSRVIEAASGAPPAERLVRTLAAETEGNPLFLTEMVRLLAADGRLRLDVAAERQPEDGGPAGVPQSVRTVVGRRLDHLSAECSRILTVAAVAGRDFDLPVLERVTELPADTLLALLEEAEIARLIAEAPAAPGRYRFTHALSRETLYEDLPATRRARLHRQMAEALEAVYAGDAETHLAELAHHFAAAAAAGGADKAVAYLRRAGDRALAVLAYEEAARLYTRALAVLKLRPGAPGDQVTLLLALGDAQSRTGDRAAGWETFSAALSLARQANLAELQAHAAMGLAGETFVTEVQEGGPVAAVLEEALAALDPHDHPLRAAAHPSRLRQRRRALDGPGAQPHPRGDRPRARHIPERL